MTTPNKDLAAAVRRAVNRILQIDALVVVSHVQLEQMILYELAPVLDGMVGELDGLRHTFDLWQQQSQQVADCIGLSSEEWSHDTDFIPHIKKLQQKCSELRDVLNTVAQEHNEPDGSLDGRFTLCNCLICKTALSSTSPAQTPCQHLQAVVHLLPDGHEWCSSCGALFRAGPGAEWELPKRLRRDVEK